MIVKVSELKGAALDWAVAKCEDTLGYYVQPNEKRGTTKWEVLPSTRRYSTNWAQGGPLIDKENINLGTQRDEPGFRVHRDFHWHAQSNQRCYVGYGPTPLIAAMRCYVSSKLGDDIEIPKELYDNSR